MSNPRPPPRTIAVFGGATVDIVAKTAAAAVMGASNPGRVRRSVGGVGFNVAMILSRLGLPTVMATVIGRDPEGEAVRSAAEAAKLATDSIGLVESAHTATYLVTLDASGELILGVADMTINAAMTPAMASAAMSHSDGFRVADANLPEATLAAIAARSAADGVPLAALTVSPAKAVRFVPLLDQVAVLFTNRREASALLGRPPDTPAPADALAAALARNRSTTVIVTDGAAPVAVATGDALTPYTPPPVTVRAVNGAGDSFAAGVIAGLATGKTMAAAIGDGFAAAALTLTFGSVTAAPFAPGALDTKEATAP